MRKIKTIAKKRTRRVRNSLNRAEILSAALKIIQTDGVESLSMRSIAKHLNCSVASPYAHFKNQEEIIQALLYSGEQKLTADLNIARASTENPFGQITAIAHTYWQFSVENQGLHKLMFSAGGGLHKKLFAAPSSYRVFLKTVRDGLKKESSEMPRPRYNSIARTMWAWMYGLLVLQMTEILNREKLKQDPIEEGMLVFKTLFRNAIDEEKSKKKK
ncbi:MAG: TetR/AcrR family transcriptional regulator [Leptospiraceae bacterium]|jgi:AcrR family transcriptional regulator|nr:TetR/AcrR family transcriptional regulator [Leptospiraceae bacterium]